MRSLVALGVICVLGGCAAASIPLTLAVGTAITSNATSRAEAIPQMNCRELRARWDQISGPLAGANPTRLVSAERSLIRQTSRQRGCPIGS